MTLQDGAARAAWLMAAALLPWMVFVPMYIMGTLGSEGFLWSFVGPLLILILCRCIEQWHGLMPLLVALIASLPIALMAMENDRLRHVRFLFGINFLPALFVAIMISFVLGIISE